MIEFLSARPVRGATSVRAAHHHALGVSIRTPRAGRDERNNPQFVALVEFLSARPVRGATGVYWVPDQPPLFLSARPVRGATYPEIEQQSWTEQFLSARPVRGATLPTGSSHGQYMMFLSARPVRGATPSGIETYAGT